MIILYFVFATTLLNLVYAESWEIPDEEDIFAKQTISTKGIVRKFLLSEVNQLCGSRNAVVSPIATLFPLAQLYFAGDRSTQKEIENAFGTTRITHYLDEVVDSLRNEKTVKVGMYLITLLPWMYEVTKAYKEMVNTVFNTYVQHADFSNLTIVAKYANLLMDDITGGVVKEVVRPSDMTPRSSLVLLGATIFKGEWYDNFTLDNQTTLFNAYEGKILTRYMTSNMKAYYIKSEVLKAEIIQIPYKGREVAFTIFLPLNSSDLLEVVNNIKTDRNNLQLTLQNMTLKQVNVSIPRFEIETEVDMIDVYKKMGVEKIFVQGNSGLDNLLLATSPWISNIRQSLKFVCNENSTTAIHQENARFEYFRANSEQDTKSEKNEPEIIFKASHPFIFYVLYKGEQLFAGIVNNPNKVMRADGKMIENVQRSGININTDSKENKTYRES